MTEPGTIKAYQLKITLSDLHPPIWRRVLVPEQFTLSDLHKVIQEAFGWEDYHLHAFEIHGVAFGEPDPEGFTEYQSERKPLGKLGLKPRQKFRYEYDFGDSWIHEIAVEKVQVLEQALVIPVCLAGERACPPEDSGGPWGFQDILDATRNPDHPDHEEFNSYLDPSWDPEAFSLEAINILLRAAFAQKSGRGSKKSASRSR